MQAVEELKSVFDQNLDGTETVDISLDMSKIFEVRYEGISPITDQSN